MKRKRGYGIIAGLEKPTPEQIKQRNIETYGANIKKYRQKAGLTSDELADILQIAKSSVRNWESGFTRPDPEYLYRMFSILDVEPNEFFGFSGVGTLLTEKEKKIIKDYRSLDEPGREDLETYADAMSQKIKIRKLKKIYGQILPITSRQRRAAAGDGEDWTDHPETEQILLYNTSESSRADEIFFVSGKSMVPMFQDHDKVLVQYCKELHYGEIGVFYVPGHGGVIKQVAHDRLHSINPEYDDIFPYEDGAEPIGRVVGKVTKDMIPRPEDIRLYEEAVEMFEN